MVEEDFEISLTKMNFGFFESSGNDDNGILFVFKNVILDCVCDKIVFTNMHVEMCVLKLHVEMCVLKLHLKCVH